ncbi:putative sugar O-methyltransferase [Candidatus Woesebacteria bacterium]|nr:putative sugar O-methyltransferase [Candidatus Woesebacteria bacterium]
MKLTTDLRSIDPQKNRQFLKRVSQMFSALKKGRKEVQPSRMWEELNEKGMEFLKEYGYENFKRTMVRHYFANTPLYMMNKQIVFLILHLNPIVTVSSFIRSILLPVYRPFNRIDAAGFNFITFLIWEYTKMIDKKGDLAGFSEPTVGNPPPLYQGKTLISQDIANSWLEYRAIYDSISEKMTSNVLELGAGSGRNAYMTLKMNRYIRKYIIVDIPPALAVAEQYLTDIFPKKKIFRYRQFKSFKDISGEFKDAEILFFLPSQIELLPNEIVDLSINISSLHEMRQEQIQYYFDQIARLTRKKGYFYFKQWKVGWILQENTCIRVDDYPIKPKWKSIYLREARVQTKFFEQLLQKTS